MKQLTLILLLFAFNQAFGQKDFGIKIPKIEETGKYGFTEIYESDSLTATELYNSVKIFLTKRHSDKEFFIDIHGKELYDHGSFQADRETPGISMIVSHTVLYTISIEFKENKMRIILTDFKLGSNAKGTQMEVPLEKYFQAMNTMNKGNRTSRKMNESLSKSIVEQSEILISELKECFNKKKTEW